MKYILAFFVFINFCYSQDKVIVSKFGTITFIKQDSISDRDLVVKSFKDLIPEMKEQMKKEVYNERLSKGIETDTTTLNKLVESTFVNFEFFLPIILEEKDEKKLIHYEIKDKEILKYYEINGQLTSMLSINTETNVVKNEYDEYIEIFENEIIEIKEIRDQRKIINDYECFKVIYSFRVGDKNKDNYFINNILMPTSREMWVTERIKYNYHPIISESQILEKYYPLEIMEKNHKIKGLLTIYKLITLNFKQ